MIYTINLYFWKILLFDKTLLIKWVWGFTCKKSATQKKPTNGFEKLLNIYDLNSYRQALENSDINPILIGTLEVNANGQQVFKMIS